MTATTVKPITIEEYLNEIRRLEAGQSEGSSVEEIVKATGWAVGKVHRVLKQAKEQGRLATASVLRKNVWDRMCWVPIYRILPAEEPAKSLRRAPHKRPR